MAVQIVPYKQQVGVPNTRLPEMTTHGPNTSSQWNALEDAGSKLGVVVAARDAERKQISMLDAESKLLGSTNELLYTPETGALAQQGKNAFGVADRSLASFDTQAANLGGEFTDAASKEGWKRIVMQHRLSVQDKLLSHEATQHNAFAAETTKNYLEENQNTAALNYTDPTALDGAITRSVVAVHLQAQREGWPPEKQAKYTSDVISGIYSGAMDHAMAQGDTAAAQTLYDTYGKQLSFDDADKIATKLRPLREYDNAINLLDHVESGGVQMNAVPTSPEQGAEKLLPVILRNETRGLSKSSADNAVSTAGAQGAAQFMLSTAQDVAKKHGIPFAPADLKDRDKSLVLLKAHLTDLCKKFNGDERVVLAAYNMGEGAAAGWAAGKPYHTQDGSLFKPAFPCDPDAMPAETRNYVSKGLQGGPPPSRTDTLAYIENSSATPREKEIARTAYSARQTAASADRVNNDRAITESVWTKLENSPPGTPLVQVISPDELAWVNANGKRDDYDKEVKRRIGAVDTGGHLGTVGQIDQLFYQASGGEGDEKKKTAQEALATFKPFDVKENPGLTDAMRQHFAKLLTGMRGKDAAKVVADVKFTGDLVHTAMFQTFGYMDEPTQEQANKDTAAQEQKNTVNQFRGVLGMAIRQFTDKNKKPPTQEQVQRMSDVLLLESKHGVHAFQSKSGVAVPADYAASVLHEHPTATPEQIKKAYLRDATSMQP